MKSLSVIVLLAVCATVVQGQWDTSSTFTHLPANLSSVVATTVGNLGLFADTGSSNLFIYNYDTNAWTNATYPSNGQSAYAAAAAGNVALFESNNGHWLYNTQTATFTSVVYPEWIQQRCVTSAGNKIFVAGGVIARVCGGIACNLYLTTVDIYDASTNTWSTSDISLARCQMSATSVGNLVFFGGGFVRTGTSPSWVYGVTTLVDIYDMSTNSWATANLALARFSPVAVSAGRYALFLGGMWSPSPNGYSDSSMVDMYDTVSHSWSSFNLPYTPGTEFYAAVGTSVGTQAVVITPSPWGIGPVNYTIFESANQTWTHGSLPIPISSDHGMAQWTGMAISAYRSRVLVAGGGADTYGFDSSGSNAVYIYDTAPYIITPVDTCQTDADCNGHGICISSHCSCFSGFGGKLCDARPDSSCTYSPVDSNTANFSPAFSMNFGNSSLNIQVTANLEDTRYLVPSVNDTLNSATAFSLATFVQFDDSATPCDYPGSWVHPAAAQVNCHDKYYFSVPWATAVSQCGFSAPAGSHTWSKTVTATRMYQLPDLGDGVVLYRNESKSQILSVVFPVSVITSTEVVVEVPSAISVSAIVAVSYSPATDMWVLVLKTLTGKPYKLASPQIQSTTGEILTDNRVANSSIAISGTCTDAADCSQTITLKFAQCQGLSGSVFISALPVCSGDACNPVNGTVLFKLTLNTQESCPIVNEIQFSVAKLASYSNSSLLAPKTDFAASQIAYFGADIQSTNASIAGLTVQTVCFVYNGEPCTSVLFQALPDAGGKSPVFSIDLAQTRSFTNATSAQSFSVQATIAVTWTNGKRTLNNARVNIQSEFSVASPASTSTTGSVVTTGSATTSSSSTSGTTGDVTVPTGEEYMDSGASLMASLLLVIVLVLLAL